MPGPGGPGGRPGGGPGGPGGRPGGPGGGMHGGMHGGPGMPPPPPPHGGWGRYRRGCCMPGCLMYVLGAGGVIALLVAGIASIL
ncbi:MAG: hypothetical protein LUC83_01015 [Clostridiales bacterium]|nr:hypothetical protein [Clostridiales bacterium]